MKSLSKIITAKISQALIAEPIKKYIPNAKTIPCIIPGEETGNSLESTSYSTKFKRPTNQILSGIAPYNSRQLNYKRRMI